MKIQCQTRELLDAVSLVSGVVPGNPTRPVLHSAKLQASRDGLQIIGTDLEVGLQSQVDEVMVDQEGTCLVPCARLVAILREIKDPELTIPRILGRAGQTGPKGRGENPL